jgi:hypothetical protein
MAGGLRRQAAVTATEQGRAAAVAALQERRRINATRPKIDNASLRAGSPMYFSCIACGGTITVPETWITKPDLCEECTAMQRLGWLE